MAAFLQDLGPAIVNWAGSDVGDTQGGVILRMTYNTTPTLRDKTGDQSHDEIFTGAPTEIEVNLAGPELSELAALMPATTLSGTKATILSPVGQSMRDTADVLIIKPIEGGGGTPVTDQTKWMTFDLAAPKPDFEVPFDSETQRIHKVTFVVFSDLTTAQIAQFGADSSGG